MLLQIATKSSPELIIAAFVTGSLALIGAFYNGLIIQRKNRDDVSAKQAEIFREEVITRQFDPVVTFMAKAITAFSSEVPSQECSNLLTGVVLPYKESRQLDVFYSKNWEALVRMTEKKARILIKGGTLNDTDKENVQWIELKFRELLWYQQTQLRNLNAGWLMQLMWKYYTSRKFKLPVEKKGFGK